MRSATTALVALVAIAWSTCAAGEPPCPAAAGCPAACAKACPCESKAAAAAVCNEQAKACPSQPVAVSAYEQTKACPIATACSGSPNTCQGSSTACASNTKAVTVSSHGCDAAKCCDAAKACAIAANVVTATATPAAACERKSECGQQTAAVACTTKQVCQAATAGTCANKSACSVAEGCPQAVASDLAVCELGACCRANEAAGVAQVSDVSRCRCSKLAVASDCEGACRAACSMATRTADAASCQVSNQFDHLCQAIEHLQAAGMTAEADALAARAERLRAQLLEQKFIQLQQVQSEIEQLRAVPLRAAQVAVHVEVAEISLTRLKRLGFGLEAFDGGAKVCLDAPQTFDRLAADPASIRGLLGALKRENLAKVIAAPTIAVPLGRVAHFQVGGEVGHSVRHEGAVVCATKNVGTSLDLVVMPAERGALCVELRGEFSEHDASLDRECDGLTVPGVRSRTVDTGVTVEPGKTAVIRGLVQKRKWADDEELHDVALVLLVTPEFATSTAVKPASHAEPVPAKSGQRARSGERRIKLSGTFQVDPNQPPLPKIKFSPPAHAN